MWGGYQQQRWRVKIISGEFLCQIIFAVVGEADAHEPTRNTNNGLRTNFYFSGSYWWKNIISFRYYLVSEKCFDYETPIFYTMLLLIFPVTIILPLQKRQVWSPARNHHRRNDVWLQSERQSVCATGWQRKARLVLPVCKFGNRWRGWVVFEYTSNGLERSELASFRYYNRQSFCWREQYLLF